MIATKISPNFWLSEFEKSSTAVRYGIDNLATTEVKEKLELLCLRVLQPTRDYFVEKRMARGMTINSGFRCQQLNHILGSSSSSQHVLGEAADVEMRGVDNYVLATWISENLEFDQLILEFYDGVDPSSGWVHVSYKENNNRGECLTINKGTVKRGLIKG